MTACIFPGQGSQTVGMLADLAGKHDVFQQYYHKASERLGFDLGEIIATDSNNLIQQTAYTQPAILAASCALWQLWNDEAEAVEPVFFAGHSLGEYSAAVAAGVLTFEDAIALVHTRGKLMQQAVPEGEGMMAAVVGLDDDQVRAVCTQVQQELGDESSVSAANLNAPGQVVVAGKAIALDALTDAAKKAGARKVMLLPVSVPSHCALMQTASLKLADAFAQIDVRDATVPLVQNIDAQPHTTADDIVAGLIQQLYKPVLWTQSIQYIHQQGVTVLYECGPGKVLQGLTKRIQRDITCVAVADDPTLSAI